MCATMSEEKLCAAPKTVPCRGYNECVLGVWLQDGKVDCFDGSDECSLITCERVCTA
jgi:hypothetical protein